MAKLLSRLKKTIAVRPRFIRRLFWVLLAGVFLWAIYGWVGDHILRPIAQRQIQHLVGADVRIGSMDYHPDATVVLHNVSIYARSTEQPCEPILTAGLVQARFSFWSILTFKPRLARIKMQDFTLNIVYDRDRDLWNLDLINIASGSGDRAAGPAPFITATRGIASVSTVYEQKSTPLIVVGFSGSLSPVISEKEIYTFYIDVDNTLGFGGSNLRGIWKTGPAGNIAVTGKLLMGKSPLLDNNWTIEEASANIAYDRDKVTIERLWCRTASGANLNLSGSVTGGLSRGHYEVAVQGLNLPFSASPAADKFYYSPALLSVIHPAWRRFFETYRPQGRADVALEASGDIDNFAQSIFGGTFICRDFSIYYSRFPYLLHGMEGVVDFDEKGFVFNELHARHNDVLLCLKGRSRRTESGWADVDINITSPNLKLDDDLYLALNQRQKKLWFSFTPSGTVAIDYRFVRNQTDGVKPSLKVELIDVDAVYKHFPYELKGLKGSLAADIETVTLENVTTGYPDGRKISLAGQITHTLSDRPQYNMDIIAEKIPVDSRLTDAMPPRQRKFYEQFTVDAVTDVNIKVFPDEAGPGIEYIAEAKIYDGYVEYEGFPVPLTNVTAEAVLTRDAVRLKNLQGSNMDGTVNIAGTIWPSSDPNYPNGFCLDVKGRQITLSEELFVALPRRAADIVARLNPRGKVNVAASVSSHSKDPNCSFSEISLECLGNDFTVTDAGDCPIGGVTGRIVINQDHILFEDFNIGTVDFDGINPEKLDTPLAQIHRALKPAGTAGFYIKSAKAFTNPAGNARFDLQGNLALKGCSFGKEGFFSDSDMVLDTELSYLPDEKLFDCSARIAEGAIKVKGRLFEAIAARINYDGSSLMLTSEDFTARCCTGPVIGDLKIDTSNIQDLPYQLDLAFDSVDMACFTVPEDSTRDQSATPGRMNGSLNITGSLAIADSVRGRLNVSATDMHVAKRSFAAKIISALQLDKPEDYMFEAMNIEAYLKGSAIILEQVRIFGKTTLWNGRGSVDMLTGSIDLDLTAFGRPTEATPSFIESLARGLSSAMVKARVTGSIENPLVETTTLSLFKSPFESSQQD